MNGAASLLACLVAALVTGCATPSATIDTHSTLGPSDEEPTAERVSEDGVKLTATLDVAGLKGRDVSLLVYDAKGCAAEKTVHSDFSSSRFNDVEFWIPWSRLCDASNDLTLKLYVASPDEAGEYLATENFTWRDFHPFQPWTLRALGCEDGDVSGVSCFRGRLRLDVRHVDWQQAQIVFLAEDGSGRPLCSADGSPIRVLSSRLQASPEHAGQDVYWNSLEFLVPYSSFADLDPSCPVTLSPALEVVGQAAVRGTLHFHVFAGGPEQDVEKRLQDDCSQLDEEIRATEECLDALGEEQ